MDEPPPVDEQVLVTRREEAVALFESRMARWQHLQAAALAVGGLGYIGYLGDQVPLPMLSLVFIVAALSIAVSAGVQAGHEKNFQDEMRDVRIEFAKLKAGRSHL